MTEPSTPPLAFDGQCGVAVSLGRSDAGSPDATRVIDGHTVQFRDKNVRMLSHLFTGRIRKKLAASS